MLVLMLGGHALGARAVKWGVSALEAGFDSPSLRLLAGLDGEGVVTTSDARPLLDAALGEIGVSTSTLEEAGRLYVREISWSIVRGEVAPRAGADLVHERVVGPLGHPHDLMPWCYVWEGNASDCSRQLGEHEQDAEITTLARRWVQAQGG
jgi:hypothetical protein